MQLNFQPKHVTYNTTQVNGTVSPITSTISIVCDTVRASNGDSLGVEITMNISSDTKQIYNIDGSTNSMTIQFTDVSNRGRGGKNKANILYGQPYDGSNGSVDLQSSGAQFQVKDGGICMGKFNAYFSISGDKHTGFTVNTNSGLFYTTVAITK